MAGLLNTDSIMMCPHGGTVSAVPSSQQVMAGGSPALSEADTFLIAGCAFFIGPAYHPCVRVQWAQPDSESRLSSGFTLSEESVGLCVAADNAVQGTVLIIFTQSQVSGL